MNKKFFSFILKIIALVLLCYITFVFIVKKCGMYIMDEEYAYYKQTMDYVNNSDEYNNVLIFGDSVAKAGVVPNLIKEQVGVNAYNIAMAGATPIEQYYIMQDYLENHEPPKAIVMMYFIGSYDTIEDFFWNRTIYFDCLTTKQFKEIMANGAFDDNETAYKKFLEYKLASPTKYYAPLKNATIQSRYQLNKSIYEKAVESRGQHFFGEETSFKANNTTISDKDSFEMLDVIELYMNKCIEQCEENGIQVIIEQHPINLSTYANMQEKFRQQYQTYMMELKNKYPNIIVNWEYEVREDAWFGDFSHLNLNGATLYTWELIQKYGDYFK